MLEVWVWPSTVQPTPTKDQTYAMNQAYWSSVILEKRMSEKQLTPLPIPTYTETGYNYTETG